MLGGAADLLRAIRGLLGALLGGVLDLLAGFLGVVLDDDLQVLVVGLGVTGRRGRVELDLVLDALDAGCGARDAGRFGALGGAVGGAAQRDDAVAGIDVEL